MGARLRIFLTREQDRTLYEPIHRCLEVQKLWSKWEQMGLYIFFLPKYCSEMNPIELEWQHLKKDEVSGQIFDDEFNKCLRRN